MANLEIPQKAEGMHSKMQSHAARERSGLRSWFSLIGFIQWPSFESLQLVTKLIIFNCPYKLTMCLLVTKCFTSERPLKFLSLTVILLVTKHPHACQQCPLKKGTYTHLDMFSEVTKLS